MATHFRILTAQGPAAPGGAKDYVSNGEMSGGFALVAWPAQYDATGIMTFIVNGDGTVLEKDLGQRRQRPRKRHALRPGRHLAQGESEFRRHALTRPPRLELPYWLQPWMPLSSRRSRWRAATARMNPSVIREILKVTERPGIISLAGGLPSADTFPVEAMREATARVLRDAPREALQYAASEGYGPLREWVAERPRCAPGHDASTPRRC